MIVMDTREVVVDTDVDVVDDTNINFGSLNIEIYTVSRLMKAKNMPDILFPHLQILFIIG